MQPLLIERIEVKEVPSQVGVVLILYFVGDAHYWKGYFEDPTDAYDMRDSLKKFVVSSGNSQAPK